MTLFKQFILYLFISYGLSKHFMSFSAGVIFDVEEGECYETPIDKQPFIPHFENYHLVAYLYYDSNCTKYYTKTLLSETTFSGLNRFIYGNNIPKNTGANLKLSSDKNHGINNYWLSDCADDDINKKRYMVDIQNKTVIRKSFDYSDINCTGKPILIETFKCYEVNNDRYMDCSRAFQN
ncbi:hypothetical protein EHI8A_154130 [Entamoeba histolytica HM-1:IMSS-B]|nr:Hypothetical protein EHI5A_131500 [Entamoeba histolytica KU27]EMH77804.1 hypothetical protein EHI8A_154130 [Entamoeba histolytica HM-1:IMSS-B]EMS17194.1 hypothetical protein KM1_157010 [Entamoeba histolytica HM-3:IMSS]GAT94436.1 hypothetical protein CL6EHI_065470 [Entamoeba histolytica]